MHNFQTFIVLHLNFNTYVKISHDLDRLNGKLLEVLGQALTNQWQFQCALLLSNGPSLHTCSAQLLKSLIVNVR
jgi:hypothetical protein